MTRKQKCKCLTNNRYEVTGICDITKFNALIAPYDDKTWTHFIITETTIIPVSKPPISQITRVSVTSKVISKKNKINTRNYS